MGGKERLVIHGRRGLDPGGGIAGNIRHGLLRRHGDIAGVLRRIQDVPDGVAGGFHLGAVDEGEHVLTVGLAQAQGLAAGVGPITGHGNGILGDVLLHHIIGIGDRFVRGYGIACFIHIFYGVGQVLPDPVGVNGGVRRDRVVPIVEGVAVGGGVPAVKGVTRLGGRTGAGDLLVLFYGLIVIEFGGGRFSVHKAHGVAGSHPLGVEMQVVAGHGGECVWCAKTDVRVPAAPAVVVVHPRGPCGLGVIAGDVCFKEYGSINRAVTVVRIVLDDIVLGPVVVEAVGVYRACYRIVTSFFMAFSSIAMGIVYVIAVAFSLFGDFISMTIDLKSIADIITTIATSRPIEGVSIIICISPHLLCHSGIAGAGITLGRRSIAVVLGIAADFFGIQATCIQADLGILIGYSPGAVRLLQPVFRVSVLRIIRPPGRPGHLVVIVGTFKVLIVNRAKLCDLSPAMIVVAPTVKVLFVVSVSRIIDFRRRSGPHG